MSKFSLLLSLLILSPTGLWAQSIFLPERGNFDFDLWDITKVMAQADLNYVSLRSGGYLYNTSYKLDTRRNEYQIRNWYQQDWFKLQDMFSMDVEGYISKYHSQTFNEAKRRQYLGFAFDKKGFFHYKKTPAMREWGGLTHPPIKTITKPLDTFDRNFKKIDYKTISSPYFSPSFQVGVDSASRSELTFGNSLHALVDHDAFVAKKNLIRNAKKTILMSSLVFICDSSTKEIVNLLIKKRRDGLAVKVIADGVIGKALGHRECLVKLAQGGVDVVETKDFFKHKGRAIYHTKTLVTDFSEAIAGGHNMLNADNLSRGTDFTNRDVDLYVKGPMVMDIAKQFVENWNYQGTLNSKIRPMKTLELSLKNVLAEQRIKGLRGSQNYGKILSRTDLRMKGVCRFIKQAPYEDRHTIGKAYLRHLSKVSRHLVITDPIKSDTYSTSIFNKPLIDKLDNFDMFNQLHQRVQLLAKAGRKIDYLTTNINMAGNENVAILNDKIREQLELGKELQANWSLAQIEAYNKFYGIPHYKNLMKDWMPYSNVHVWTHISFLHSKIFYFDRVVASVGSYNFQHNATDHAYESTSICMDEKLNQELDKILVQDMANSIPLIFSGLK